jgi:hypothetical protein
MAKGHCKRQTKTGTNIMQKYSPNVFLSELLGPSNEGTTILQNVEKYLPNYKAEYFRVL